MPPREAQRSSMPMALLLWALTGCSHDSGMVIVNQTDVVVTAVFDRAETDLLAGAELPPSTFVQIELPTLDTGTSSLLEAYTVTGSCAEAVASRGLRWEIAAGDLDPGGC